MPATGTPAGSPRRLAVSPNTPADGFTSGKSAIGTPRSRQQLLVPRAAVDVEAEGARGVGRVGGVHAPPVSCQSSHESTVPKQSSPRSARGRSAGTWSSIQRILVPEKYGVDHQAGLPADLRLGALGLAGGRRARRCAGTARRWRCPPGRPEARSHRIGGLALVGDADRRDLGRRDPRRGQRRGRGPRTVVVQISAGSCSTQPGCGKCCGSSA